MSVTIVGQCICFQLGVSQESWPEILSGKVVKPEILGAELSLTFAVQQYPYLGNDSITGKDC